MTCAMCKWIAGASLHPQDATDRMNNHTCEDFDLPDAAQLPVPPDVRARTLLAHLWRKYDAGGISMGRSHEAVVLETAMALLGDPDLNDLALLDKDSGTFINDTRNYLSAVRSKTMRFT